MTDTKRGLGNVGRPQKVCDLQLKPSDIESLRKAVVEEFKDIPSFDYSVGEIYFQVRVWIKD